MNDDDTRTLDAENSLHAALARIQQGLGDLDRFKSASASLDQASQNSVRILEELTAASRLLTQAAESLRDESLAAFEAKIDQVNQSVQTELLPMLVEAAVSAKKQLALAQKVGEEQRVANEAMAEQMLELDAGVQSNLKSIKILVLSGLIAVAGVVVFGFYQLGAFGAL